MYRPAASFHHLGPWTINTYIILKTHFIRHPNYYDLFVRLKRGSNRRRSTLTFWSFVTRNLCTSTGFQQCPSHMEHTEAFLLVSLLITVFSFFIKVEDDASSASFRPFSSFMMLTLAPTSADRWVVIVFFFFSVVGGHIMSLVSYLGRFILILRSAESATENSNEKCLYKEGSTCCSSALLKMFHGYKTRPPRAVSTRGWTMFITFIMDIKSLGITSRRLLICK